MKIKALLKEVEEIDEAVAKKIANFDDEEDFVCQMRQLRPLEDRIEALKAEALRIGKKKFHTFYIRSWNYTMEMAATLEEKEDVVHFPSLYDEVLISRRKSNLENYESFLETKAEIC